MTAAFLITDRKTDVAILERLLPPSLTQTIRFYAADGKSSAISAAATLLTDRMRPIAIVLDADTENPSEIREKIELANTLLYPASSPEVPFKVFMAAPSIASILSQHSPVTDPTEILDRLTPSQIQTLQQHPLIQQLIEFLSSVTQQVA
jgi:hypothetical protein